jgi:ketosteroid isomerase-like protein
MRSRSGRSIADRAAAMHDRDADRFVSHYAPQITKFDPRHRWRTRGGSPRRRGAARLVCQPPWRAVCYEIRDLAVTVGGDVAFCHSLN